METDPEGPDTLFLRGESTLFLRDLMGACPTGSPGTLLPEGFSVVGQGDLMVGDETGDFPSDRCLRREGSQSMTVLCWPELFEIRNHRFEIYIAQKPGGDCPSFTDAVHSTIIRKERN